MLQVAPRFVFNGVRNIFVIYDGVRESAPAAAVCVAGSEVHHLPCVWVSSRASASGSQATLLSLLNRNITVKSKHIRNWDDLFYDPC